MAQCFELLATKSLGGDISCMEWCPTMDLLALVTADSQLMVHRRPVRQGAEFHKLFTHAGFDHPVTCLVWRPDGQVLAVGHADGSISLFGVEEGEQIGHAHEHSEALCLFRWVAASADDDDASAPDYSCSLVGIFPPLPQLAKQGSVQQYLCEEGTPPLDATLYRLLFEPHASLFFDIAVTADTAARVHLAVHGRFSLGCVPIAELSSGALTFGGSTPSLLAVQLASSLHALTVVARTSAPSHALLPDGTWQEQPAGTLLLAFRTGQLTRARREIRALALSFMQCKALASRAKEGLHAAQRLWQEAVSPLHTKMASLAAKLQDTRGLKTVSEQLAVLLAAGVPSPLLQAFFSTELREIELTRALKCLGVAASALTQLCLMHVHPALEILIQRLSHLEGLSKWPFHFAALGLQPPRVAAALEAAASLRASAELLLVAVRRTTPELCAFLGWLVRMVRKVRDEPPPTAEEMPPPKIKVVAAFLLASRSRVGGLPYDQVNDLFAEYDSAQGTEGAAPPPPLLSPEDDDALSRLAPLPMTCRLPVAILSLESMLGECFSPVAHHVSAGFQLHSCTPIDAASAAEIEAAARPDSSRSAPLLIEVLQPEPQVTVASKVGTGASGRAEGDPRAGARGVGTAAPRGAGGCTPPLRYGWAGPARKFPTASLVRRARV